MVKIKPIRQKTVVQQALAEIRRMVESGSLKPGDRLPPEDDLARTFGISKQSVREAIKVFDYLGITSTEPGRGTFISRKSEIASKIFVWSIILGEIDLDDLMKVRESLEIRGIRKITDYVNSDAGKADHILAELRKHLSQLQDAVQRHDEDQRIEADYLFHETLISGTGNSLFVSLYETFQYYMMSVIQQTQISTSDPDDLIRYHKSILDAVSDGDTERAIAALSAHMKAACWDTVTHNHDATSSPAGGATTQA